MPEDDKDLVKSLVTQLNKDVPSVQISQPYYCNYWIINEKDEKKIYLNSYYSSTKSSIWESLHGWTDGMKRQPNRYQGAWI